MIAEQTEKKEFHLFEKEKKFRKIFFFSFLSEFLFRLYKI